MRHLVFSVARPLITFPTFMLPIIKGSPQFLELAVGGLLRLRYFDVLASVHVSAIVGGGVRALLLEVARRVDLVAETFVGVAADHYALG